MLGARRANIRGGYKEPSPIYVHRESRSSLCSSYIERIHFFFFASYFARSPPRAHAADIRSATHSGPPTGSSTTCSRGSPLRSRTAKEYSMAFAVDLAVLRAAGAPLLATGNHRVLPPPPLYARFLSSLPPSYPRSPLRTLERPRMISP